LNRFKAIFLDAKWVIWIMNTTMASYYFCSAMLPTFSTTAYLLDPWKAAWHERRPDSPVRLVTRAQGCSGIQTSWKQSSKNAHPWFASLVHIRLGLVMTKIARCISFAFEIV